MSELSDNIRRVTPYVPGEQTADPGVIKLNTNENPYPPSPAVDRAICSVHVDDLRLYPDATAARLVNAVARVKQLRPEQVFVGVGSDDVLALCFLTFFNGEKPILFPDITYSFYEVWANLFRIPFETRPLTSRFEIDPHSYEGENGGVVLANPNAPTGVECPEKDIEAIVRANRDAVVIVDEAYVDFGATSALPLLNRYDNLVVVQTLSKSHALAGMRVGYACASPALIKCLSDVRGSFNSYPMNLPALLVGEAAILDVPYFEAMTAKIIDTREQAKERLAALGFTFCDSRANFLFVTHESVPARELFEALRLRDIYVRYFDRPRIANFLRITIGTDAQMEMLYTALEEYLSLRKENR